MEVNESKSGEVLIVSLRGHLDTVSSQPLEERMLKAIAEGERKIVFDCTQLDYVNSSGLKAVLVTAKQLDTAGGRFMLCGLSPSVHLIFEMIGFTRILSIVPTIEEALRNLQPESTAAA